MQLKTVAGLAAAGWLVWAGPVLAASKPVPAKRAVAPVAASAPAAASPAIPPDVTAEFNRLVKNNIAPRFTVLDSDVLDAETRAAALVMQAEHVPRVRALMDRWMLEELQAAHAAPTALRRVMARLTNEFALWGRDSLGEAQDAALTQALQMPGMCRPAGPNASELVMRLSRLRGLPPAQRQQAVQAERELLARWGQVRQVSEAEPLAAEEALLQLRASGQPPKAPLPPVLAYYFLGDSEDRRMDPILAEPSPRCALHQWAGASASQFRAAMAMQAADFYGVDRRKAASPTTDDDGYPTIASFFGARGLITLEADVNAEGHPVRFRVVKRAVKVPGIGEARPFAHEGPLELATLAKAREMDWSAAAPKQGLRTVTREFNWSLAWE